MSTRSSIFEQFLMHFDEVVRVCNDNPQNIVTFYEQSKKVRDAVDGLSSFLLRTDFDRRVFHSDKKYHPQAPKDFEKTYGIYKDKWSGPVESPQIWALLNDFDLSIYETAETKNKNNNADFAKELTAPDPDYDTDFDPSEHDGRAAFELALNAAHSWNDDAENGYGESHYVEARIGLQAVDYLRNTIGLDVEGVFRRWRSVPVIFMHASVSNSHGLTDRGSLFDLIDDAVRSYVFGAPAAAMATCRAVLEMVLKHHYNLDYQVVQNGKKRDRGIGELIFLAEKKYDFVPRKRLSKLTKSTNKIMHNYSSRTRMSEDDEKIILDFMKIIKFLIENAPKKDNN